MAEPVTQDAVVTSIVSELTDRVFAHMNDPNQYELPFEEGVPQIETPPSPGLFEGILEFLK